MSIIRRLFCLTVLAAASEFLLVPSHAFSKTGPLLSSFSNAFESQNVAGKSASGHGQKKFGPTIPDWIIPNCGKPERGFKRTGWGKHGIQFPIPTKLAKIKGGKWDVDYVVYFIERKSDNAFMRIWFGVNMYNPNPDYDLMAASSESSKRNITSASDNFFGVDNWGRLPNGNSWRHTSIAESMAEYRNASSDDAAIFDKIINSMCVVPTPKR